MNTNISKSETIVNIDVKRYNVYTNKDGRLIAYDKTNHKIVSYPRIIMETYLGRKMLPAEVVHHKDRNPLNNNVENLEVLNRADHTKLHMDEVTHKKYYDKIMVCPICNKEFLCTAQHQRHHQEKVLKNIEEGRKIIEPLCSNRCVGIYTTKYCNIENFRNSKKRNRPKNYLSKQED